MEALSAHKTMQYSVCLRHCCGGVKAGKFEVLALFFKRLRRAFCSFNYLTMPPTTTTSTANLHQMVEVLLHAFASFLI